MPNVNKFLCFEHCVVYTEDDMMCHECEKEICEEHDNQLEKEMTDKFVKFVPNDSTIIQEDSLTNFMAGIGYEPVYKHGFGLRGFRQPKFKVIGQERVSVNRAIKLHNTLAEVTFREVTRMVSFNPRISFAEFASKYENIDRITDLFAGTCKIVHQVKANFSRRKSFVVHDHNIKFMTKRDERQYSHMLGA